MEDYNRENKEMEEAFEVQMKLLKKEMKGKEEPSDKIDERRQKKRKEKNRLRVQGTSKIFSIYSFLVLIS